MCFRFPHGVLDSISEILEQNRPTSLPDPEVIKLFSCSTQLSMKFELSMKIVYNLGAWPTRTTKDLPRRADLRRTETGVRSQPSVLLLC